MIEKISVSALFALTEIVFESGKIEDSVTILGQFLEYLLGNKKYAWIKYQEFKGLIWDLVIVAIRYFPTEEIEYLMGNKTIVSLLKDMYKISIKKVFIGEESKSKNSSKGKKNESNSKHKDNSQEFIRFYKSFVFLSIHLSIKSGQYECEIVPFKENIQLFKVIYEL